MNKLVRQMKKIAHVPIHTWNGFNMGKIRQSELGSERWKSLRIITGGLFLGLLIIPCLIPCITLLVQRIIQGMQFTTIPVESHQENKVPLMVVKVHNQTPKPTEIQLTLAKFEAKTRINDIQKKMRDCDTCSNNLCQLNDWYRTMKNTE